MKALLIDNCINCNLKFLANIWKSRGFRKKMYKAKVKRFREEKQLIILNFESIFQDYLKDNSVFFNRPTVIFLYKSISHSILYKK